MRKVKKIYLAGPEVFLKNAVAIGELKKQLCQKYGFEGLFPLDNEIDFSSNDLPAIGLAISRANEALIHQADIVIANMTPFRGASTDVGTDYEMGFAKALGKEVYAYTNDTRLFMARNLAILPNVTTVDGEHRDALGLALENFNLIDNLMLDGGVFAPIVQHELSDKNALYTALEGFEDCLKLISKA